MTLTIKDEGDDDGDIRIENELLFCLLNAHMCLVQLLEMNVIDATQSSMDTVIHEDTTLFTYNKLIFRTLVYFNTAILLSHN